MVPHLTYVRVRGAVPVPGPAPAKADAWAASVSIPTKPARGLLRPGSAGILPASARGLGRRMLVTSPVRLTVFLFISKLLDLAIAPLTWALMLALSGAVLSWRKHPRAGLGCTASAVALLWLFSSQPVGDALTRRVESAAVPTIRDGAHYDAAIVLGGIANERAMRDSGQPAYNDGVDRLIAAHRLYKAGSVDAIVVSGGCWTPELRPEAEWLADQLVEWGVPRDRVVVDSRSLNTRENALNCATIAGERGWDELVLITSAAHLPRAAGTFAAAGLKVDLLPVDFHASDTPPWSTGLLPRCQALEESTRGIRELVGRGVYRLFGYSR